MTDGAPIRLLVTDNTASRFAFHLREGRAHDEFCILMPEGDAEAELIALAREADAALCYQAPLSGAVIKAARALKFIQKHGLNCRNIDVAAAARRGIPVATLPLMRNVTVAEHALALILACSRRLIAAHHAVASAAYQAMDLQPTPTSQGHYLANWPRIEGIGELYQATAGIVGMGDIGMEIAKRCRAFGMNIVYYQRTQHDAATEAAMGMQYLPFDALLASADYVVLVVPHTRETDSLIDQAALARMKPGAALINIGRGGLVDEAALAAALERKQIAMAGLDVYRTEPLPSQSPLRTLPNVVLTPHIGGGSYRSWEVDMPAVLANIKRFFATGQAQGVPQREGA
ncbi:MAG: D-glycerate dehydrogenase [Betaproteobacteria bacterium]|nr:D-glycerate dehydrogenase [Betaproteobacteria bacterium]